MRERLDGSLQRMSDLFKGFDSSWDGLVSRDEFRQALQALEKLSHEHPLAILRAGGMLVVLQYVDFFATGVQRIAVSTAANSLW